MLLVVPRNPKLANATENPFQRIVTTEEISWITSLLTLGAMVAPFLYGFLADNIGRKPSMLLVGVPFFISYIMLASGKVVEVFYFARVLSGIGLGGTFTLVPIYIGEIAESKNRGLISCLTGAVCSVGLLFSVCLGPFTSMQYFNTVLAIPPLIFLILFAIMGEESPIYLVKRQKIEEAETALYNLGRSLEVVKKDVLEMQTEYENKEKGEFSLMEMIRSKALLKGMISSLGLLVFQQLSGINAIMFYNATIFEQAGTKWEPHICTIVIVGVQFVSSFIVPFVVDSLSILFDCRPLLDSEEFLKVLIKIREILFIIVVHIIFVFSMVIFLLTIPNLIPIRFGRKLCLLLSAIGMIASEGPLALYCHLRSSDIDVDNFSWIPIVTLTTFIIAFNFGYGPLPWTILSEMFATKYRSFASAIVSTVCWMVSFLITKYFQLAVAVFGLGNVFFFSTVCCALAIIFCCVFVVETKGKSLHEIQEMLNS